MPSIKKGVFIVNSFYKTEIPDTKTAAHNIATVFCKRFLDDFPSNATEKPDFTSLVKNATDIYCNAYAIAFTQIDGKNKPNQS